VGQADASAAPAATQQDDDGGAKEDSRPRRAKGGDSSAPKVEAATAPCDKPRGHERAQAALSTAAVAAAKQDDVAVVSALSTAANRTASPATAASLATAEPASTVTVGIPLRGEW
jgi:hypothetical protein